MAIVETTVDPDGFSYSVRARDAYPLTRWETAGLILDVGLLFTPFAAVSAIRKATYIRKGIQTVRAATAGKRVAAVEKYMVERPIRTFLFAGGTAGGYIMSPVSPVYTHIVMARTTGDVFVAFYIDREGKIFSFLPSDQFIRDYHQSSGEDSLLTIRTGTPDSSSFYDGNGLAALKSIKGSTPPLPKWTLTSSKKSRGSIFRGSGMTKGDSGIRRGARTPTRPWWFSTKAKRRISRR